MTPFQVGSVRSNLPVRNSMMTAITDATVIIEASEHQAGTKLQSAFGRADGFS